MFFTSPFCLVTAERGARARFIVELHCVDLSHVVRVVVLWIKQDCNWFPGGAGKKRCLVAVSTAASNKKLLQWPGGGINSKKSTWKKEKKIE